MPAEIASRIEQLGHVAYERDRQPLLGTPMPFDGQHQDYSDETERYIDHAVRELIGAALERAVRILQRNRAVLEETAQVLLRKTGGGRVAARGPAPAVGVDLETLARAAHSAADRSSL